jgi:hypothetical protein
MKNKPLFNKVFDECHRVVGLAGEKNTGKTNNVVYLIDNLLNSSKKKYDILIYGFQDSVTNYLLAKKGIKEISSLKQLAFKKDTIIIIDEFQRLKLNDRRHKDKLNELIDFIYHNNNFLLLSSPNIREFNNIIGGHIERWLLKTVKADSCINGSQLKKVIDEYKGRLKRFENIVTSKKELIIINDDYEQLIKCDYVEEADNKKENKTIFE